MKVESNEVNETQASASAEQLDKNMPKDAQIMASMLRDMGVAEWEPRVINQLLEFSYNYVTTILDEAKMLSTHARKKNIDVEDVQLAVQMYTDKNVTCPPHRDLLLEVARSKNASTLPVPKPNSGLRLPPDRFCLNACNYKLKSNKRAGSRAGPYYYAGGSSAANQGSGAATTMIYNKQMKQIMVAPTPGSQGGQQPTTFTMTPAGLVANPRPGAVVKAVVQGQNKVQIQPSSSAGPQVFTMTINPNSAAIKRES